MNVIQASRRGAYGRVCVVVHGWPKLSSPFVAQELVGLEQRGFDLLIATFGKPDKIRHPIVERIRADILRLPKIADGLGQFLRGWLRVRGAPGYAKALALLRSQMKHGEKKRHFRAFLRGVILADRMPADVRAIYAHFIGRPASVARYASLIRGLPLAGSAHARDIWTGSRSEVQAQLAAMEWCATCTKVGAEYLKSITPDPEKVRLIYHGLSIDRVPEGALQRGQSDGTDAKSPVKLLSVGRAVEKKGFDILLEALAKLPTDLNWSWIHVGDGAIMADLKRQSDELGLQNRIEWRGAQDQTAVFELLRRADLFVLPSREGSDGDKDGLPNVLMEAQSQELACLSTNFSEIPELIEDGRTGVLVPPGDAQALAVALERLIRSPDERQKLGRAGRERVTRCFDAAEGIGEIAELLRDTMQDHVRQSLQRELA